MSKMIAYLKAKYEQNKSLIVLTLSMFAVMILFVCFFVVVTYISTFSPFDATELILIITGSGVAYVTLKAIYKDYKEFEEV